MLKKISQLLLFSTLLLTRAQAQDVCQKVCSIDCCDQWYGLVGAGYAFSLKAGIDNPDPSFWDASEQGYDNDLGNSAFFMIGFGRTFCGWYNFDVTYSFYQPFHYQKYQTTASDGTPGFTGLSRTRYFDLDHQNLMFDLTIDPVSCFNFNCLCLSIRPVVGVGIGVGVNRLYNFHTVGFVDTDPVGVGSTSSIGEAVTKTSFAWQVIAALRFALVECCPLTMDLGYRYYDGGHFQGPSTIVANTTDDEGGLLTGAPWKGKLKANEIYMALNWGF